MGKEGKYDLKLVEQPLTSDTDSETESEDACDLTTFEVSHYQIWNKVYPKRILYHLFRN